MEDRVNFPGRWKFQFAQSTLNDGGYREGSVMVWGEFVRGEGGPKVLAFKPDLISDLIGERV